MSSTISFDCPGETSATFVQFHLERAATALLGAITLGVVDEDLAHRARGDGKEMDARLPTGMGLIRQAQVSLVDQGRRLQGVTRALPRHVMVSDAAQIFIDERGEFCQGRIFPVAPLRQELGDSLG